MYTCQTTTATVSDNKENYSKYILTFRIRLLGAGGFDIKIFNLFTYFLGF